MKTSAILLAASTLTLTGCASYGPGYAPGPSVGRTTMVMASAPAPLGTYLVDAGGRSLYIVEGTRMPSGSNPCIGECMSVWPPALAATPTQPGAGINPAWLSTVSGPAGSQLTYAGWPLYYYHRDRGPGDTTGQHVRDRWGTWHLIAPSGQPIQPQPY